MSKHDHANPERQGDEYFCADCGRRWGFEEEPPGCNLTTSDPRTMESLVTDEGGFFRQDVNQIEMSTRGFIMVDEMDSYPDYNDLLSFKHFQEVSKQRSDQWSNPEHPWNWGDWGNALAGETGELCNILKKIRRIECDMIGNTPGEGRFQLRTKAAKEIADVIIYAMLIASELGVDVETVLRDKFNRKSEELGFEERV